MSRSHTFNVRIEAEGAEVLATINPTRKHCQVTQSQSDPKLSTWKKRSVQQAVEEYLANRKANLDEFHITYTWTEQLQEEAYESVTAILAAVKNSGLKLSDFEHALEQFACDKHYETKKARKELWKKL